MTCWDFSSLLCFPPFLIFFIFSFLFLPFPIFFPRPLRNREEGEGGKWEIDDLCYIYKGPFPLFLLSSSTDFFEGISCHQRSHSKASALLHTKSSPAIPRPFLNLFWRIYQGKRGISSSPPNPSPYFCAGQHQISFSLLAAAQKAPLAQAHIFKLWSIYPPLYLACKKSLGNKFSKKYALLLFILRQRGKEIFAGYIGGGGSCAVGNWIFFPSRPFLSRRFGCGVGQRERRFEFGFDESASSPHAENTFMQVCVVTSTPYMNKKSQSFHLGPSEKKIRVQKSFPF